MMERRVPTKEEVLAYLYEDRNWGRWGQDDQMGAVNMVTPEKRAAAARLVKSGRAISLSREFPKTPAPNNPTPAIHYMKRHIREDGGGSATDYDGISSRGTDTTHVDALGPVWHPDGRLMVVAPASITPSTTRHRKSRSLRVASSAENCTSSVCCRAYRTESTAISRHCSRVRCSFACRCRSEVAMNV